jgi:predicted nucleotidyltransferase
MTTGIIAEFNPLHDGHRYLLSQTDDLKIVVMSGNWVQRGEPAIFDKWLRAQMALEAGADIVVEMPVQTAVQGADYFGQGAVDMLARLGVDTLLFGTEMDLDYEHVRQVYRDKGQVMADYLASLPETMSYPEKTQKVWQEIAGLSFTGDTPNHVLGLAYAKAASHYDVHLTTVRRKGAGYHDDDLQDFASATAIRKALTSGLLPAQHPMVTWADYFQLLKYQVLSGELSRIFQMNDELAARIKAEIGRAQDIEDLVERVHTKRYTRARVRRLLTYVLLAFPKDVQQPQGLHILGFSTRGQAYLATIKKNVDLVTRIGKVPWDELTQRADAIYRLGNPALPEQNWGRQPIRL